jgi:short-subunit dehydrogenase
MKVTLVTGASGGIGEAIVNKLAARKQNLLLVARNSDKLSLKCKQLMEKFGIDAQFIAADLAKPETPQYIFADIQKRGLEVETLFNNAGIGSGGEFTELSLTSELEMIQLNNSAMVALTHYLLPAMQKRKSGTIVNVASMAAFMPIPYMAVYGATKVFVRSFTEAITEECKPYNIHVMLLCPGLTKTNFNNAAGIENEKGEALTAGAALQTPEQVADEAFEALDKKKNIIISGAKNRLGAKALALIPNAMIAKNIAKTYRKKVTIDLQNKA